MSLDAGIDWRSLPGRVVLKVDAEGSELAILRGAEALIRERRPVILLELNPASARAAGYTVGDLLQQLSAFGYCKFRRLDSSNAAVSAREIDASLEQNIAAIP